MKSIADKARRIRDKLQREGLIPTNSLDKRHSWLKELPLSLSPKLCVLASFCKDGTVSEHTLFLAKGWLGEGFQVLLVIASDDPKKIQMSERIDASTSGVMVRANSGYDFGSWATALDARPDLRTLALLALANDSVYGPLAGFRRMLSRVDASPADLIAVTDSFEIRHHIQSFLVFYRNSALRSRAFDRFWKSVRGCGRAETIQWSELPQLRWFENNGVRVEVLFPCTTGDQDNATLINWRRLLDEGFPFVKVQLLRENPWNVDIAGWDRVLVERQYDPALVRHHLGAGYAQSAAAGAAFLNRS